jgi:hypothetical protein
MVSVLTEIIVRTPSSTADVPSTRGKLDRDRLATARKSGKAVRAKRGRDDKVGER